MASFRPALADTNHSTAGRQWFATTPQTGISKTANLDALSHTGQIGDSTSTVSVPCAASSNDSVVYSTRTQHYGASRSDKTELFQD